MVARELSDAARRAQHDLPFLIECDTGFGRNGVQTPDEAARRSRGRRPRRPGLRFEGLMTFPNRDPDTREFFERALPLFARAGLPVDGGFGRRHAGAGHRRPLPDADRAPRRHLRLQRRDDGRERAPRRGTARCACAPPWSAGPTDDRAILDAGRKVLTSELYFVKDYGHLMEYPEAQVVAPLGGARRWSTSRRSRGAAEGRRGGQRGAEPLLRGHQHGRRGLRGARRGRGGVAGRGARPGALRPRRLP